MANSRYDLVVIGSGPGGYVAAIRAAQLKMRVAVIERDRPGGVCLNWGCIPSKALLNSATAMDTIRGASKEHGIETGEIRFDFTKVIARSRAAADKLSKGVLYLFKKNKIDYFEADATITARIPSRSRRSKANRHLPLPRLDGERILIAAGSGERLFPGMKVGDGVVTSKEALVLDNMPASVVVIGAGAIGARVRLLLQRIRRQGDDRRAGKADAPRHRRRSRRRIAPRVHQTGHHRDARPWLQIDGAQRRSAGRSP